MSKEGTEDEYYTVSAEEQGENPAIKNVSKERLEPASTHGF
jgi:hypothetical protein